MVDNRSCGTAVGGVTPVLTRTRHRKFRMSAVVARIRTRSADRRSANAPYSSSQDSGEALQNGNELFETGRKGRLFR